MKTKTMMNFILKWKSISIQFLNQQTKIWTVFQKAIIRMNSRSEIRSKMKMKTILLSQSLLIFFNSMFIVLQILISKALILSTVEKNMHFTYLMKISKQFILCFRFFRWRKFRILFSFWVSDVTKKKKKRLIKICEKCWICSIRIKFVIFLNNWTHCIVDVEIVYLCHSFRKQLLQWKKKQFNEMIKSHENNMYYFDLRMLISTILSTNWASTTFHIDMTNIVDNSFEYWHFFSWKSFIRTCSQNYVTYFDLISIIFSDFVCFFREKICFAPKNVEQMMFFDRDRRSLSSTRDNVLLRIRLICIAENIRKIYHVDFTFHSKFSKTKYIFIENDDCWIELKHIITYFFHIYIQRIHQIHHSIISNEIVIDCVFNARFHILRSFDLLHSLRAKLEISAFEKKNLIIRLKNDIRSCSLFIFVDVFELYRNIYWVLTDVYALFAVLCNFDKQKNQNCFVFILKFHNVSFKNIINDFRIEIKILDRDCQLNLNEKKTWMWVFIIAFLKNMKQQQKFAEFLKSKIFRCCRFCDANEKNRKNLNRNIILNDRYHHQILKLRRQILQFNEIIKKKKNFILHDLSVKSFFLISIIFVLNTILNYSSNSAHSEYYKMMRHLYSVIEKNILIIKTFEKFNNVF